MNVSQIDKDLGCGPKFNLPECVFSCEMQGRTPPQQGHGEESGGNAQESTEPGSGTLQEPDFPLSVQLLFP